MQLHHVETGTPGISRVRSGDGFRYIDPRGREVRSRKSLARIASLAIPPAWEDVWICSDERGHLQATGLDAAGRLQYRYHPAFRAGRDAAKFARLARFARSLPQIRLAVERDMASPAHDLPKVAATVVCLLERTLVRVGNGEYARDNGTFGLSTLRNRHVAIQGSTLRFRFTGKSGKRWDLSLNDRRVARTIRNCQELPGQHLFQYLDEGGVQRPITSRDVNGYLRDVSGRALTAKDFRTWWGTVLCALELAGQPAGASQTERKRQVAAAVRHVASRLGNTPAVCRSGYIHPIIIERFMDGSLQKRLVGLTPAAEAQPDPSDLSVEERAVLRLIGGRLPKVDGLHAEKKKGGPSSHAPIAAAIAAEAGTERLFDKGRERVGAA